MDEEKKERMTYDYVQRMDKNKLAEICKNEKSGRTNERRRGRLSNDSKIIRI